jgi:hypothetical protein
MGGRMGTERFGRRPAWLLSALAVVATTGCELDEVTLVEARDVVVAEVLLERSADEGGPDRLTALLHRTLAGGTGASRPVPGARVLVRRSDGFQVEMGETTLETCVVTTPVDAEGTCFWATPETAGRFQAGDHLQVEVSLADGGQLVGALTVPGAFDLLLGASEGQCSAEPEVPLELRWTRSQGSSVYVNETLIYGIRDALAPQGIEVDEDPLYLLGLSASAEDTTIVFPGEFGVFNRFELDQGLALALQRGLPAGTDADVSIAAAEDNYVNWVRGGSFNPSGQVRIPSLRGDGTGLFGAVVVRRIHISADTAAVDLPRCSPS